jgi:glycosyltransferase involved in cell wall biosynthesis
MKIGIDASRSKSGGSKIHLISILNLFDPDKYDFKEIHLWSYDELLNSIPNYSWLKKHICNSNSKNIVKQLYWQFFDLPKELKANDCKLLFCLDGGSVCRFSPYITMSRDMLSFEKKEFNRYFISYSWFRLFFLRYVQLSSFKNSIGTIFLTNYAKNKISQYHNISYETIVINHGISNMFRIEKDNYVNLIKNEEIFLTLVSNADLYKHNWNVIEAVFKIRDLKGWNIKLQLIGSMEGNKKALNKIDIAINKFDPENKYVLRTPQLSHKDLIQYLKKTDLFIFSSTCENMPNTLIEGMSTGLPILCSSFGPMPEVIQNGAMFFDPYDVDSLVNSITKMIIDDKLRLKYAFISKELSKKFSWEVCANETFEFVNKKLLYGSK